MANTDLLSTINAGGEVDTSLLLDTLMYVNVGTDNALKTDYNDMAVKDIVKDLLENGGLGDEARRHVQCVQNYIENHPNSEICNLKMHSCSDQLQPSSSVDGAKAASFYATDSNGDVSNVYVAYRGTGEGRWYDNGDAFAKEFSQYQQDGARYFDKVMDELKVTENTHVNVTGHSKGANLAQFVTVASKNAYLVDNCYSFDGQGFSPEAIEYFKKLYGEDFYEKQLKKMYSVSGDNDYVNVLGVKIIPDENTVYIKTPTDTTDLENSHGLVDKNGNGNLFNYSDEENAGFNEPTAEQRDLARFAKVASDEIMQLPKEEREAICRSLMSLLERYLGGENNTLLVGLNDEQMTWEEFLVFVAYFDEVGDMLLNTEDGKALVDDFVNKLFPEDKRQNFNKIFDGCMLVLGGPVISWVTHGKGADFVIIAGECLLKKLSQLVAKTPELIKACEFVGKVVSAVKNFFKENFDKNYKAAKEYIGGNSILQFDTGELYGLAERLWAVNGRLQSLDYRLDGLYRTAKWTDLGKIIKVASADFKIGWSNRVNNCANCLNDTANRFEKAESEILNLLGE